MNPLQNKAASFRDLPTTTQNRILWQHNRALLYIIKDLEQQAQQDEKTINGLLKQAEKAKRQQVSDVKMPDENEIYIYENCR